MSEKNFRVVPAGDRTNVEGKAVTNKVLLATPDNEYELMRPDLMYIDLPHQNRTISCLAPLGLLIAGEFLF